VRDQGGLFGADPATVVAHLLAQPVFFVTREVVQVNVEQFYHLARFLDQRCVGVEFAHWLRPALPRGQSLTRSKGGGGRAEPKGVARVRAGAAPTAGEHTRSGRSVPIATGEREHIVPVVAIGAVVAEQVGAAAAHAGLLPDPGVGL